MHKLKEKRGRSTVTHHFSHVTEKDGTKKHVYLGTDPEKSKEKLVKLRVARIRSDNQLIKELDEAQQKLNKLGHYNHDYEQIVEEMKKNYYKEMHAEKLIKASGNDTSPFLRYTLLISAGILFTAGFYLLFSEPAITGAAVKTFEFAANSEFIKTTFYLIIGVVVLGLALYGAEYRHAHRHDKYKP